MVDRALSLAFPLIAQFEGFSSTPYKDQAGVWTCGFGFTYDLSGSPITATTPAITQSTAMDWLQTFVGKTMDAVRDMVHVPMTDNQAAALCSFSYNLGTGALRKSSLLLAFNQGRTQEAADDFMQWIYVAGRPNTGLRNRRTKERALFLSDATPTPQESPSDDLNNAELKRVS